MKYLGLVVCILLMFNLSIAQVASPDQQSQMIDKSIFGLGFSAGVASGFGLSFRHHLPGDFSYQFIAGIVKADKKVLYNLGGEMQYDFVRGESTRFFGSIALGYFFDGEAGKNELTGPFRTGAGIGVEFRKLDRFHIGGELLFTYFTDGNVLPLPQVSAHYYFF